jgi:hypothetical protein
MNDLTVAIMGLALAVVTGVICLRSRLPLAELVIASILAIDAALMIEAAQALKLPL